MDTSSSDDVIPSSQDAEQNEPDVIQPIGRETVHRICSGQVVLSLAIAMKELVENAIDASATNIEIKLREYGSELLEVSDNGSGVKKENFKGLTQKHWTSKIRKFEDLEFVNTLGFRGEALSSLCGLADLTVTTKHSSADHATKIKYDHNGAIVEENPTARTQGTTITLENLFSTLPVRRKEFIKNLKREFNKMCQLLYAYCLVSKGIKFSCTNITSKGSKTTVVATQGLNKIRDNIIGVFGSKQISSLVELELVEPDEQLLQEFNIKKAIGDPLPFTIECFISSAVHGSGRSTSDRQFYFINSRPCDPTKIIKLVNEVYRHFNGNQYPFVFMNITAKTDQIDVNVTPDKRQVFLEQEKLLLASIKASLLNCFRECPSTYSVQNLDITKQLSESDTSRGTKRSLLEFAKSPTGFSTKKSRNDVDESQPKLTDMSSFKIEKHSEVEEKTACFLRKLNRNEVKEVEAIVDVSDIQDESTADINLSPKVQEAEGTSMIKNKSFASNSSDVFELEDNENVLETSTVKNKSFSSSTSSHALELEDDENESNLSPNNSVFKQKATLTVTTVDEKTENIERCTKKFNISMDAIKEALNKRNEMNTNNEETIVNFRSKISPDSNQKAEQELQRQITKEMFKEMDVIGQFNLGFIIAKLKNDLFIIDQHATDEKYNFEMLQLTTVLENQKLVVPKPLHLTAANEELLIDNQEIFNKNGFTFKINQDAEATNRILLTSIPISKNYIFGKDDIDEMLFMLQDGSHTMVRPSRVRGMFASRACRKSVMIGRALCKSEMKRLIEHMSEIDQPWNCPHGRPTMRHLINLSLINYQDTLQNTDYN